jgi:hypothetical protein
MCESELVYRVDDQLPFGRKLEDDVVEPPAQEERSDEFLKLVHQLFFLDRLFVIVVSCRTITRL